VRPTPVAAFVALVVATIAAFFITQHLKVATPLIQGSPSPTPSAINPAARHTCLASTRLGKRRVNFWQMKISFYLQNRSDDVDVYIVDQNGNIVSTLAADRYMRGGQHPVRTYFTWDGRRDDGSLAPDGTYYVRVFLIHQARSIVISNSAGPEPVKVMTVAPRPVITGITPLLVARGGTSVTVHYRGTEDDKAFVKVYGASAGAALPLVKSFSVGGDSGQAIWDTKIGHRPAPAGRYLVRLQAIDAACNVGWFPARLPAGAPASRDLLTVG
jgi:hypothetical protein